MTNQEHWILDGTDGFGWLGDVEGPELKAGERIKVVRAEPEQRSVMGDYRAFECALGHQMFSDPGGDSCPVRDPEDGSWCGAPVYVLPDAYRGAVEALEKYAGHLDNCAVTAGAPDCDCGFDEAMLRALGRSGGR